MTSMVGLNSADDQQPFPRQMKILSKLFSLILITLRRQSTKMTPPFKVHTLLIADSVPILPNAIKLEVTYFRYPQPNNTKNKNKKIKNLYQVEVCDFSKHLLLSEAL